MFIAQATEFMNMQLIDSLGEFVNECNGTVYFFHILDYCIGHHWTGKQIS